MPARRSGADDFEFVSNRADARDLADRFLGDLFLVVSAHGSAENHIPVLEIDSKVAPDKVGAPGERVADQVTEFGWLFQKHLLRHDHSSPVNGATTDAASRRRADRVVGRGEGRKDG